MFLQTKEIRKDVENMYNFEIFTDSSADLPKEIIEKYQLKVMQLEVTIDDKEPVLNKDVDIKSFYDQLRAGANAKTAAVTLGYFEEHMRACLESGKDILYVGFSSGLSATYNNGVMMIRELETEFPERKIYYTDTLCASAGQGLLVYYAAKLRDEGASAEEILKELEAVKDYVQHQITVDDLFFLQKGGRLSAVSAVAGSVLKIKPIIVMDIEGHLKSVGKVRGRKNALRELYAKLKSHENFEKLSHVFITHADCIEDAKALEEMVKADFPEVDVLISDIGPVIGAHTGPGGLALCYLSTETKDK